MKCFKLQTYRRFTPKHPEHFQDAGVLHLSSDLEAYPYRRTNNHEVWHLMNARRLKHNDTVYTLAP